MRLVVVGYGVQGKKRVRVGGDDVVSVVDPVADVAQYPTIDRVPLDSFDAAAVCTPDAAKAEILRYLLGHGKHVLVEKPLLTSSPDELDHIRALSEKTGTVVYTAYNHRFEPHLQNVKELLETDFTGRLYQVSMFYGNGTARNVRESPWRDHGMGVIADLASHLLDLSSFFVDSHQIPPNKLELWVQDRFENQASDYFLIGFPDVRPMIRLEGSLLSWRNRFTVDITAEDGSIHIDGLCKWGPASLTTRTRKLPSGKPDETVFTLEEADQSWVREYDEFKMLCGRGETAVTRLGGRRFERDVWINNIMHQMASQIGVAVIPTVQT